MRRDAVENRRSGGLEEREKGGGGVNVRKTEKRKKNMGATVDSLKQVVLNPHNVSRSKETFLACVVLVVIMRIALIYLSVYVYKEYITKAVTDTNKYSN